ncbi:hypothetical protein EBR96_02870 [bacterium]|nr:hypothetical protein [bacterium]
MLNPNSSFRPSLPASATGQPAVARATRGPGRDINGLRAKVESLKRPAQTKLLRSIAPHMAKAKSAGISLFGRRDAHTIHRGALHKIHDAILRASMETAKRATGGKFGDPTYHEMCSKLRDDMFNEVADFIRDALLLRDYDQVQKKIDRLADKTNTGAELTSCYGDVITLANASDLTIKESFEQYPKDLDQAIMQSVKFMLVREHALIELMCRAFPNDDPLPETAFKCELIGYALVRQLDKFNTPETFSVFDKYFNLIQRTNGVPKPFRDFMIEARSKLMESVFPESSRTSAKAAERQWQVGILPVELGSFSDADPLPSAPEPDPLPSAPDPDPLPLGAIVDGVWVATHADDNGMVAAYAPVTGPSSGEFPTAELVRNPEIVDPPEEAARVASLIRFVEQAPAAPTDRVTLENPPARPDALTNGKRPNRQALPG